VIFKFNSFEDISTLNQPILPPADDIKTTPQDLARLKEARAKDPAGFNKASHGGNTGKRKGSGTPMDSVDPSKISSIHVVKSTDGNTRVNNNPIELPEKK
jgi:hypothetical protein